MNPKHKKILIAVAIAIVTFLGYKYGIDPVFVDQAIQIIKEQDETVVEVPVVEEAAVEVVE